MTIGALALRASITNDVGAVDLVVLLILGVQLPLLLFMLQRGRRRVFTAALAVCFALIVNVSFASTAIPAAGFTDNSSVFAFARTATFVNGGTDMKQNYAPSGSATTCAMARSTCSYFSDQFSTGQTMNAGTAQADVFLSSSAPSITRAWQGGIGTTSNACGQGVSRGAVAYGDVLVFACAFRGGTGTTITGAPSGWTLIGSRVDNSTNVSLVVYWHVVTDPSSEPTSYSWNLSASVKLNAYFMDYNGVDISSPSDVDTGQSTASGTSHTALGVTTTTANDMLLTFYATATCVTWTPPSGMTQIVDFTYCANAASSNVDMSIDQLQLGSAGATGDETATDDSAAVGVTKTIALKPAATCHVTETLTKITPIALRAATTNTASGTSVVMNTPTSQQNDVMFAFLSFTSGITPTAPAGWTQNSSAAASGYLLYSYRHVAGASEPSTYTWTFSGTASIAGWIGSYSGVDTTTPTDVNNSSSSSTATTFTTPTVTTTIPDDMIVTAFIIANNSTWTAPTRMTAEGNPIAGAAPSLAVFDGIQPVTASISRTATASTSGSGVSTILGLRPSIAATTIGSTSFSFANPTSTTLETTTFSTSAVTFATGERLEFDVTAGSDCNGSLSYDGTSAPSQLTVATIVVGEAVAGLLLLAPALPLAWRQRRR